MTDQNFISIIDVNDPEYWDLLKRQIKNILHFETSNYRDKFLMRRIECRLRKLGIHSYKEYSTLLTNSEEEQKLLEKELTIHVTRFFRDKNLFQELRDWIFPQFIKEKMEVNNYHISIWSAGCSTGQEAYSIAIILREVLGDNIDKFNIKIKGTDIEEKTINSAREGLYDRLSFIEMPQELKEKYFTQEGDFYRIKPELKSMVEFEIGDILKPVGTLQFDFIFCRNTVIYFEKNIKQDLYESIFSKLKEGGFLILGKTEFLDGTAKPKFEMYNINERIYRKPIGKDNPLYSNP
ncbi:MAG: CheR family methyltransferase [Nanobdellota archaeon]